jgi:hypothetical protein
LGDIVDIRDRLLKRRVEEAIEKAGGLDYVEGMRSEREAELESVEQEIRGWCDKILDDLLEWDIADESVEFSTDFIFMTEALRSLILRARGFDHFVQGVAEKLIEVDYDEKSDMVHGRWKIEELLGEDNPFGDNDPVIESYGPDHWAKQDPFDDDDSES